MSAKPLKVRFYVDMHNFRYGVAVPFNIEWIDMEKLLISLARDVEPAAQAEKIFLFSAPVKGEDAHANQQAYLGCLQERSPCIEVVNGEFIPAPKRIVFSGKTAQAVEIDGKFEVRGWVEKQTDVNIGCQIVKDAFMENPPFDACCLVTSDRDLLAPLKIKKELGRRMFLILPRTASPKAQSIPADMAGLVAPRDLIPVIRKGRVRDCRLPDKVGKYTKPAGWK